MKFNKERFFEKFRPFYKKETGKNVSPTLVKSIDFLLEGFEKYPQWNDLRYIAYAMSTIAHETAWTFRPIKEYRGKSLSTAQKRYWNTGYFGRGYVQLTWDFNYKKAGQKLGVDLLGNPDLALNPDIAIQILAYGMIEGWFTGKKLSDYITKTKTDYKSARRIINGTDHWDLLAATANDFDAMFRYALVKKDELTATKPKEVKEVKEVKEIPSIEGETYPEDPKPGEPVPDESAKEGQPVVGGRPNDEAKVIEAQEPIPTSGWGVWLSNIRAQWASLGIGGISLGSLGFLSNPLFIKVALGLLILAAVVSLTVYITSMYLKSKEKRAREKEAHEITMKQLDIASDPTKYNIVTNNLGK